jgi:hypothetical protein
VSEEELVTLAALGERLEAALSEGDVKVLLAAWDHEAVADAVCAGIELEDGVLREFRAGMLQGMRKTLRAQVRNGSDDLVTFKGVRVLDGRPMIRIRRYGESGISFVDYEMARRPGGWRIVNAHDRLLGGDAVVQTRQMLAPMIGRLDAGILARWLGLAGLKPAELEAFGAICPRRWSRRPACRQGLDGAERQPDLRPAGTRRSPG